MISDHHMLIWCMVIWWSSYGNMVKHLDIIVTSHWRTIQASSWVQSSQWKLWICRSRSWSGFFNLCMTSSALFGFLIKLHPHNHHVWEDVWGRWVWNKVIVVIININDFSSSSSLPLTSSSSLPPELSSLNTISVWNDAWGLRRKPVIWVNAV